MIAQPVDILFLITGCRDLFSVPGAADYFHVLLFIFLILAVLGLCCCMWTFSSCGQQGLFFVAVRRLLIVVVSLTAEHRL